MMETDCFLLDRGQRGKGRTTDQDAAHSTTQHPCHPWRRRGFLAIGRGGNSLRITSAPPHFVMLTKDGDMCMCMGYRGGGSGLRKKETAMGRGKEEEEDVDDGGGQGEGQWKKKKR
mmetsp:Transcript_2535/g.3896  ORF Transcript_2535/g.3896 Transcript_2535/m.3896 type:complete len:116 (+) Transcript_2535:1363-1710(+)